MIIRPKRRKPPPSARVDWNHPLARGLLAYYPMNDGGGTVVRDLVRRHNGTNVGTADYVPGNHGGLGLYFDGTNDYVGTNFVPPTGSANRSVAMWIKPETGSPTDPTLIEWGSNNTTKKWAFRLSTTDHELRIEIAGSGYNTSLVPPKDEWSFVAIVLDGTTLADHTLYLNTQSEAAAGAATLDTNTNNDARIGHSVAIPADVFRHFQGVIGDVWIYDRALSASELSILHREPYAHIISPGERRYALKAPAAPAGPPLFIPEQIGVHPLEGVY